MMQPYFSHFVFEAIDQCDLTNELSLGLLRRWTALIAEAPGSLKEVWFGFDCDYSHAWGGTPAYQLSARILGVEPLEPGFRVVSVAPALGNLERIEGVTPTPFGNVNVVVERMPVGVLIEVDSPAGVGIEVSGRRMLIEEPSQIIAPSTERGTRKILLGAQS
jgi:hypothetical protein